MKTAILITDKVKQIMFTPENAAEREALKYISPNDEVHTVIKRGTFYDRDEKLFGVDIYECQGGYFRAEDKEDSVMFVVRPKDKKDSL